MQVGIVGFAGGGKTTLFNTLTGLGVDTGYGKREINTGTIDVPDERIDRLAEICNPKRIIYAKITFTDVPGQASSSGGALEPKTLQELRNMEALVQVVRAFESPMNAQAPDPVGEATAFQEELRLADQIIIEKRLERLRKEKGSEREKEALDKCLAHLEQDKPLLSAGLTDNELSTLSGYRFLSLKPVLVVVNVGEDALGSEESATQIRAIEELGLSAFSISAALEEEIAELETEEQEAFLADLGVQETAKSRFIRAAYGMMDLISFLTQGPDEARAWTIRRGTNAKRAARTIHSDLERGFIRAEVIKYVDFLEYPSEAACREVGKAHLEGKEYIVEDGDIMHIRANV